MRHVTAVLAAITIAMLAGCASAPPMDSYGPAPHITISQIAEKIGPIKPGTKPLSNAKPQPAYQTGIVRPIGWQGYLVEGDITPAGDQPGYYYVLLSGNEVSKVYEAGDDSVYRLRYANGRRVADLPDYYRVPECYGANGCYVPEDWLQYR